MYDLFDTEEVSGLASANIESELGANAVPAALGVTVSARTAGVSAIRVATSLVLVSRTGTSVAGVSVSSAAALAEGGATRVGVPTKLDAATAASTNCSGFTTLTGSAVANSTGPVPLEFSAASDSRLFTLS
ncbi:MAG: hypothetical protein NVS9B4_16210 [Candidatus Acidiferrum sp.]